MTRIEALANITCKAWHMCGEDLTVNAWAWLDYAEFAWGSPVDADRDGALAAINALLSEEQPQEESDILRTWKMMLEVNRAG